MTGSLISMGILIPEGKLVGINPVAVVVIWAKNFANQAVAIMIYLGEFWENFNIRSITSREIPGEN